MLMTGLEIALKVHQDALHSKWDITVNTERCRLTTQQMAMCWARVADPEVSKHGFLLPDYNFEKGVNSHYLFSVLQLLYCKYSAF